MNKRIERQINRIYTSVFNTLYNRQRMSKLAGGSRVEIIEAAQLLESSKEYSDFATKFAAQLAKEGLSHQRGIWRKYYRAAQKLHYVSIPKTYADYEAIVMSNAVKQNFTMIKSIPRKTLEILEHKYTSTLIEEVAKGSLTRGSFKRQLESHGHKNAGVIARTETAKLQTVILESRAVEVGSVAYTWLSSKDKRTRPSHRAMDGVIVFWRPFDQKPLLDSMRGNAGEFPNCRCSPQPIVDVDDLSKSAYKVYDYINDRVITMRRHELIKALKSGSLQVTA